MIKIEIKNRFTGKILFEYSKEGNTIKNTVLQAVSSGADLREADLSEADLRGADLSGANLRGADLREADLRGADLSEADLREADLSEADLSEADLREADLRGADLSEADLREADLRGADLRGADLREADLREADLSEADLSEADLSEADLEITRNDFWARLLVLKHEVPAFKEKLMAGEIDGSCYEGTCCCFIGTMANIKEQKYNTLAVKPNAGSPTERWFLAIRQGYTPANNQVCKITLEWIEEFESMLK